MRSTEKSISVGSDFKCPPASVWQVLTDPESYCEWYGYRKKLSLEAVEPAFCTGARLTFKNLSSSKVVTDFRPEQLLAIGDDASNERFVITLTDSGCHVELSIDFYELPRGMGEPALHEALLGLLRALKSCAYERDEIPLEGAVNPTKRLFPASADGRRKGERPLDREHHDAYNQRASGAAPRLGRGALLAALLFMLVLFGSLLTCLAAGDAEVVPSSGLSVMESERVDLESALSLKTGMYQFELERLLSCGGSELTLGTFKYESAARTADGVAAKTIYAVYDAYGRLRDHAYVDRLLAVGATEISADKLSVLLEPGLGPDGVSELAGLPITAFRTDKSGRTLIYFGRMSNPDGIFDKYVTAEQVITLSGQQTRVEYFYPSDLTDLLDGAALSASLKQQFSQTAEYINDRAACERSRVMVGRTRLETDELLGTEGVLYSTSSEGVEYYGYSCRNRVASEAAYRYNYVIEFTHGLATRVVFTNNQLSGLERNSIPSNALEGLTVGMDFEVFQQALGRIPSRANITADRILLCYGLALSPGTDLLGSESSYPLEVILDRGSDTVIDIKYSSLS